MTGCGKEDEEDPGAAIATFQYEINPENWAEVIFMNYSQNASTFAWDFGDGNTSTDTNPTHTYGSGGTSAQRQLILLILKQLVRSYLELKVKRGTLTEKRLPWVSAQDQVMFPGGLLVA